MRGARIVVSFADGSTTSALSDENGQFEFDAPSGISGTVTAKKAGFAPSTTALPLGASTGVRLVLDQGAAISGRIVDQIGAPIAGMRVQVQRVEPTVAGDGTIEVAETNDLGEFRIGGLSAGGYKLAIDSMSTFAPAFTLLRRPPESKPNHDRVVERSLQLGRGEQRWMDISFDDFRIDLVGGAAEHAQGLNDENRFDRVSTRPTSIQGRIVSPDGLPIAGAVVQALPVPSGADAQHRPVAARRYASSDIDGRYVVRDLKAWDWKITVARSGFVDTSYGQRRSTDWGELVHVRDGDHLQGIDVMLLRGGIVSGTVVDRFGEPLEGLTVRLLQNLGGVVSLSNGVAGQRTDDRGQYRLFDIPPGSYYVVVTDDPSVGPSIAGGQQVFYPGSDTLTGALPLRVEIGSTLLGIGLPFVPGRLSRVFGSAIAADGQSFKGEVTLAVTARSGAPIPPARRAAVTDGVFEFTGVPQGDYVLQATSGGRVVQEFGMAFVTVNDDAVGPISVTTLGGTSIRGRVTLEDTSVAVPRGLGLLAVSADRDYAPIGTFAPQAQISTDRTFEMDDLVGFRRLMLSGAPQGWWIKSALVDGVDASTTPVRFVPGTPPHENVEIVLSNKSASIVGEVTNVQPPLRSVVGVLVFPTDSNRWQGPFIVTAGLDQDGHFKVLGIPPGDYWVAARTVASQEYSQDMATLLASLVPSARRITLRESAVVSIQLTVVERAQ
ncbi:MAG TPA: carboxypeptidase-like regulatory domain-containing protein [Vicinamibacterales bacterium]